MAESERQRLARLSRERAAKSREIGGIPPIEDVRRRARCRNSLKLFCETYNPSAFFRKWSPDHISAINRIEEAVFHGALYAFAMPRGSGKTSICRHAALWVLSYAHCRYPFLIGATDGKATEHLNALKMFIRFLPEYAVDFPEISHPAISLGGIANRSSGQTCDDRATMIEWTADRIVLPTVPPPPNWPRSWSLRDDGMVPTSGSVVSVSGLTGEGIRGSLKTLTTGDQVRPDLVLIDDPQTRESSASLTQNATRLQLVSADVLGMAGPGESISAMMPCTVISPGDFIDQILDRSEHPMWRGERSRLLRSMPTDMESWDKYFRVYQLCALKEPPDFTEANSYYRKHRSKLDAGAKASWPQRKLDGEVSAIQHAMHLFFRDQQAFWAEYQNEPQVEDLADGELTQLDTETILAGQFNNLGPGIVPRECDRLIAGIDVQGGILYWSVSAWDDRFGGSAIAYGTFPEQNRNYFAAGDARPSLANVFPGVSDTARIYQGLQALVAELVTRRWQKHDVPEDLQIERILIDSRWQTDTVHQFCAFSEYSAFLLPAKGQYVGAAQKPFAEYQRRPGERAGRDWRLMRRSDRGRYVLVDTNSWKSFVAERLLTPAGGRGRLWINGTRSKDHQLFADHLTAEYRVKTEGRGRTVEEWRSRPNRPENHWWDTLVMTAVGASVGGLTWSPDGEPKPQRQTKKKPLKLSEMQARKKAQQA